MSDAVREYLDAHKLSTPSYRYPVLLWFLLIFVAGAYALAHHVRLGRKGGVWYAKWGMRRVAWASNSAVLLIALLWVTVVLLATVGSDYISPDTGFFSFRSSTGDIPKALWTSGSRFGVLAFALFPLVVLLALKAAPFALFSFSFFTALHADKLIPLHRAVGWLIFVLSTIHAVLWTAQMLRDSHNDRAMLFAAFTSQRFIFGWVSYICLALLMVLSLRPIRKRGYEFFYLAHMVLVAGTLLTVLIHHPRLWYWIVAAGTLWIGDRIMRATRYFIINAHSRKGYRSLDDIVPEEFNDMMVDDDPRFMGYSETQIQPLGNSAPSPIVIREPTYSATIPPPPIPPGYAHAQLLPSNTIRLTIRPHAPLIFCPGQAVYLTLPDLSAFQSHPFTICNNDSSEIVLVIKARKGLTRVLYEHVVAQVEKTMADGCMATPVYLRARIDGPFGSAGRISWKCYGSIVVICGGSGISFGLGVVDHLSITSPAKVRLIWIVREYADIAWAACSLLAAKSKGNVTIDIYVTNGHHGYSASDLKSQDLFELEMQSTGTPEIALSLYEDEEDDNNTLQRALSFKIQSQGRARRASRKHSSKKRTSQLPDPGLLAPGSYTNRYSRTSLDSAESSLYSLYDIDALADTESRRKSSDSGEYRLTEFGAYEVEDGKILPTNCRTNRVVYVSSQYVSQPLWIDQGDYAAMGILSESARNGRPKLGSILEHEVRKCSMPMLVATCGPTSLNTLVRNVVSGVIAPSRIMAGRQAPIEIYSEDFEM